MQLIKQLGWSNPYEHLAILKKCYQDIVHVNTHHVEFTLRWFDDKFVYLAFSQKKQLIKIGERNIKKRELSLNETNYGNINDWNILESHLFKKAGQVEAAIQKALIGHRVYRKFIKNKKIVYSSEIFSCDLETAKTTFKKFITL